MPKWARELTGFDAPELVRRSVHQPALQAYARTVRWAFGTPPYAKLAQERVAAAGPGAGVTAEAAA